MLDSRSTPRRRTARWMFSSPNLAQQSYSSDFRTRDRRAEDGERPQAPDTLADELPGALEQCVRNALSVKTTVEDELEQLHLAGGDSFRWSHRIFDHGPCQTDNIRRTFDREPFIEEFVGHFQEEGKPPPWIGIKTSSGTMSITASFSLISQISCVRIRARVSDMGADFIRVPPRISTYILVTSSAY
jgi:hypothetical protein